MSEPEGNEHGSVSHSAPGTPAPTRPGSGDSRPGTDPSAPGGSLRPAPMQTDVGARYRDLVELGAGGMGDVYLSVVQGPAGFSKLLVVKRLRSSLAEDPELLAMFLTEARIAARLNHPNVVQTIEVGFDGARHFIAMEYLDGQSLQTLLRRGQTIGGVPLPMHLRVLAETSAGLHYAHELADIDGNKLGVVHRDATPHNVFVTYEGQIKVVDFGIAKVGDGERTRTGVLKGKVPYMSPEQIDGAPVDRRTDVYAVGAMLWQAATGQRLWKGLGDMQVMARVHAGTIPSPREVSRIVPERLDAIVRRAMAHKKEDRYPTCADLQADLEEYLEGLGGKTATRDVGKLTAELFKDDRVKLKTLIDAQLRQLREQRAGEPLAIGSVGAPPTTLSVAAVQTSVTPHARGGSGDGSSPTPDPASPSTSPRSSGSTSARPGLSLALVAALVLVAGAGVLVARRGTVTAPQTDRTTLAPATPQTAAQSGSASGPGAPPDDLLSLDVRLEPPSATLFVDGAPLTDPRAIKLLRDGAAHRVRAEAPGRVPHTEWILFDHSPIVVRWSLERATAGTKLPPAPPPPPSASIAPQATGPTELEKIARPKTPKPPLDPEDPWK